MRSRHLPGRSFYRSESQVSSRNTYQIDLDTRVRVRQEADTYQVDLGTRVRVRRVVKTPTR